MGYSYVPWDQELSEEYCKDDGILTLFKEPWKSYSGGTRFDCGQFGLYGRDDQRRNIMTFPEFYMMYILDEDKVQAINPFEESLIEVQDEWSGHGNIVEASGREQSDLIKRESYPGINQFCFGNTLRQNGAYSAIQCQHDLRGNWWEGQKNPCM